jgi:thiamine kinase-like enzyme
MNWQVIENALSTLQKSDSGFTTANRGIVTLADQKQVFVKIGTDDNTKTWARKEIEVYEFLEEQSFLHVPKLLAHNVDRTAFALEALAADEGWDWTDTWSSERLNKTLGAMDELITLTPLAASHDIFASGMISETADGWRPLAESTEKQTILVEKLRASGNNTLASTLDISAMAAQSARFRFRNDSLVHNDVRADNGAWNPPLHAVKLIDWNWAQISDRRIDINSLLVHVHRSGFDVTNQHTDRLDADALQWLAGFWLHGAADTDTHNTSEVTTLGDYQLLSGIAALELYSKSTGK